MGYTCFELRFKARSPIFIGSRKIGFIQQTRRYIPGKTMWGAITASVARKLIDKGVKYSPKIYEDVGKCIDDSVKNTYFFPEVMDKNEFRPNFTEEGLKYGQYSETKFESTFISSFVSTATIGSRNSAMDESLHETEYILNKVNYDNQTEKVYWKGYIFVRDCNHGKISIKDSTKFEDVDVGYGGFSIKLFDALSEIRVGGDIRYGFGKLSYDKSCVSKEIFGISFSDISNINIKKYEPIFAHLLLNENSETKKYRGDIEPLVGRVYDNDKKKGFGRKLESNSVAFMPGTCFDEDISIKLGSFGILKSVT